jgi:hypothetical protein
MQGQFHGRCQVVPRGAQFSLHFNSSMVVVHLNQSGFATNLVESFSRIARNETPTTTPYCSSISIDLTAPSTDNNNSPAQLQHKEAYQSLIGSI